MKWKGTGAHRVTTDCSVNQFSAPKSEKLHPFLTQHVFWMSSASRIYRALPADYLNSVYDKFRDIFHHQIITDVISCKALFFIYLYYTWLWFTLRTVSKKILGSNLPPDWGLPIPVWVSSRYSGFLPDSEDLQIRSSGFFKVTSGFKS